MVPGIDFVPGCDEILQRCDTRRPAYDAPRLSTIDEARPRTREACANVPRPCPHVSCRYHLFFEADPVSGALRLKRDYTMRSEPCFSCGLDMAEANLRSLDELSLLVNRGPEYLDEGMLN